MPARLVFDGGAGEREVPHSGSVTFGSGDDSDHVLAAEGALVAPRHATIRHDGRRYTILDEGSTSGTFVNLGRVREHGLRDGDLVEFGLDGPSARFRIHDVVPAPDRRRPTLWTRLRALLGRAPVS
ncbi:MAG TPA: FHA domain-containing protein [Candidatus Thermoplasmatota archaeon]